MALDRFVSGPRPVNGLKVVGLYVIRNGFGVIIHY